MIIKLNLNFKREELKNGSLSKMNFQNKNKKKQKNEKD